jgi:hypothetical protein
MSHGVVPFTLEEFENEDQDIENSIAPLTTSIKQEPPKVVVNLSEVLHIPLFNGTKKEETELGGITDLEVYMQQMQMNVGSSNGEEKTPSEPHQRTVIVTDTTSKKPLFGAGSRQNSSIESSKKPQSQPNSIKKIFVSPSKSHKAAPHGPGAEALSGVKKQLKFGEGDRRQIASAGSARKQLPPPASSAIKRINSFSAENGSVANSSASVGTGAGTPSHSHHIRRQSSKQSLSEEAMRMQYDSKYGEVGTIKRQISSAVVERPKLFWLLLEDVLFADSMPMLAHYIQNYPFYPEGKSQGSMTHWELLQLYLSQTPFLCLYTVNILLRGVGQVYICNHPVTGFCVCVGLWLSSPTLCAFALIGAACENLGAGLLCRPKSSEVNAGLFGYACLPLGCLLVCLALLRGRRLLHLCLFDVLFVACTCIKESFLHTISFV